METGETKRETCRENFFKILYYHSDTDQFVKCLNRPSRTETKTLIGYNIIEKGVSIQKVIRTKVMIKSKCGGDQRKNAEHQQNKKKKKNLKVVQTF